MMREIEENISNRLFMRGFLKATILFIPKGYSLYLQVSSKLGFGLLILKAWCKFFELNREARADFSRPNLTVRGLLKNLVKSFLADGCSINTNDSLTNPKLN